MSVLFVCTGNYYRSRFAEIYYNHLANQHGHDASAFSRGFEVYKARNKGPVSEYTVAFLEELQVPQNGHRYPEQLEANDFNLASKVILMDSTEHLPMLIKYFPEQTHPRLIAWDYPDIQFKDPSIILPAIKSAVEEIIP